MASVARDRSLTRCNSEQERVTVLEVAIDGGSGHAGGTRDVLHRRLLGAELLEAAFGGV